MPQNTPRIEADVGYFENDLSESAISRRIQELFERHLGKSIGLVERKVQLTAAEVREGMKKYLLLDDPKTTKSEIDLALNRWGGKSDAFLWRTNCTCTLFFSEKILAQLPQAVLVCFLCNELFLIPDEKVRKHTQVLKKEKFGRVSARALVNVPVPSGAYSLEKFNEAWFLNPVCASFCKVVKVERKKI